MVWIGPDIGKPHFLGAVNRWYSRTEPLHSGGFADKIRNRYLSRFYGGTVGTPLDCGDRKGSIADASDRIWLINCLNLEQIYDRLIDCRANLS